jgi:glycosyltransferase involved in cell wall biosynthesis
MRIAHVTDVFLPRLGGIEMQVYDLALRQQQAGHDVTVYTSQPADGMADDVLRTARFPRRAGWISPAGLRASGPAILRDAPDVVHAHTSLVSPLAWQAARSVSAAGVPTVMTMHSLCKVPTPILRMKAPIAGWTDLPVQWTAVSKVAALAVSRMLPGHDVITLPNGIDPSVWRVGPRPTNPKRLQIVSVMRMVPRKRPVHLLRILADIRRRVPASTELKAVIIGTGPEQAAMERYLDRHRMRGWVELAGRCDRETIRQVHAESDVYLAPATLESFGIAALEARCAAVPVVAMRVGGVGEFVEHGREGLLVGSDAEMAEATARLLTSPERLQAMREHNRLIEPTTNWAHVLEVTHAAYRRAGMREVIDLRPDPLAPAAPIGLAGPTAATAPTVSAGLAEPAAPAVPASVRRFVHPAVGE